MRLIDADDFRKDLKTEGLNLCFNGLLGTPRDYAEIGRFIDRLDEQPTVEAEPVRHGKWRQAKFTEAPLYICSECDVQAYKRHKYCPECGAKMDGEIHD